jgi:iron complex outermembrane recepter protein
LALLKTVGIRAALFLFTVSLSATTLAWADAPKQQVDIPAGDLANALLELSHRCAADLVYRPDQVRGLQTRGVHGQFTTEEAVNRLLTGTSLKLSRGADGSMLIATPITADTGTKTGSQPTSSTGGNGRTEDADKEGKNSSSSSFRLAQAVQGVPQGDSSVGATEENDSSRQNEKIRRALQEVVVTGTRIPVPDGAGAQEVKVYGRDQIEQSGRTTIADFLNTLPDVAVGSTENGYQTLGGATTVQLHGLPVGTTLVLINGRRLESSGIEAASTQDFFDLNSIPLAAIERVEVLVGGSSAIYGSDAVAGVVNIILRKDFDGVEADMKYGAASGTNEKKADFAWGKKFGNGDLSLIGSYQSRENLLGKQRANTANAYIAPFGCNPGNVFTADGSPLPGAPAGSGDSFAAISPTAQGNPQRTGFQGTYGALNSCSQIAYSALIPASERYGLLLSGSLELNSNVELFTEVLYSKVRQRQDTGQVSLFGEPGYALYTVPASNPFNPFGADVGVSTALSGVTGFQTFNSDFVRPLIGAKGALPRGWHWEISGWWSRDQTTNGDFNVVNPSAAQDALNSSDPASALNPFVSGAIGSPQLIRSLLYSLSETARGSLLAANGLLRGPLLQLPDGPLEAVIGVDYGSNRTSFDTSAFGGPAVSFSRKTYALFGEVRVPVVNTLVATLAGRYDHYDDFGGKTTPEVGLEWRPLKPLLLRATYAQSFKAPSLPQLYYPQVMSPNSPVTDSQLGNQVESVTLVGGGNPRLQPETGSATTIGFAFASESIPGLAMTGTQWRIELKNNIEQPLPQVIVDNEALFPGSVVRGPSQNGQPGPITTLYDIQLNYGTVTVAGLDWQLNYRLHTRGGLLTPSIGATYTYRYESSLIPGQPATSRVSAANDDGNWAPRLKGAAALGWQLGSLSCNIGGRYVGRYRDYEPVSNGSTLTLGNFWLFDVSGRWNFGEILTQGEGVLAGSYLSIGAVNLFNSTPQFSNFLGGLLGYDPAQGDLRGRFVFAQVGTRW